ncbi:MAG: MarR family transcriptional regulator [Deinococcota bacterium]|nr:MarR family transcriptional regulator [Deinococcota bacterium]
MGTKKRLGVGDDQDLKQDGVALILEQWARERPDLDVSPMGVVGRVSRLSRIFEREIQEVFSSFGLHRGEFDVLATLRRTGVPYQLNPSELSNALMVSSGGMTNRLDRLEKAGLVARQPDRNDRRGTVVKLTEKGLRLVDEIVTEHVSNERRLLRALGEREQGELAELLAELLLSLEPRQHRPSLKRN